MSARPLRRLGLQDAMVARMATNGMTTAGDVLCKTEFQLVQMLNINVMEVEELLSTICQRLVPALRTAGDLLRKRCSTPSVLATGLPTIDRAMQGGLPTGMITEVVGPAGVGKTQTCFMMAAQTCLPAAMGGLGEEAGVIYLDTERKFSADRLEQIARTRVPDWYDQRLCVRAPQNMLRMLSQVTVVPVDDSAGLVERLGSLEGLIIRENKRLIILDSVAALMRKDFSREGFVDRQELLVKQAAILKRLADVFNTVVLVTNQVTTSFGGARPGAWAQGIASHSNSASDGSIFGMDGEGMSSFVAPALGNTWHHCVSNRLILEQHATHREISISKSPLAPKCSCVYSVQITGLEETDMSTAPNEAVMTMQL